MAEQEIFDTVAQHLLTQGEKATDGVTCRYRTPSGLKCAVGCLIPDELYKPEMESLNAWALIPRVRNALPGVSQDDADFLGGLQELHDDVAPSDWALSLRSFAEGRRLSPAVLDDFKGAA